MCTLSEVVLDIFLPNRQYQCHPYIISSTLYIFYHVQLSFCTLSTHTHTHCPCHLHVICTCTCHLLVISNTPHIPYYTQLSFRTYCLHTRRLLISVYCLQMHMLCTSHFYCCYLHMYMSSANYLSICILCTHYLQWSLIYSFLTDNTDVIYTSSLVVFIYSIMENMLSAPLLDDVSSPPLADDVCHLQGILGYHTPLWTDTQL